MNAWDRATARVAWAVLASFTALSSGLNARAASFAAAAAEAVAFHAAIPLVLLVVGMLAELAALSSAHRATKAVVVTVLVAVFAIALIASYLAVLAVTAAWSPGYPGWVNAGIAAIPDLVMVMAGTLVLAMRMRRHSGATAARTSAAGRLRRLADAATTRAEAALAVPTEPVTDTVADIPTEPVADSVTDPAAKPPRRAPKPAAKPAADPSLEPFMDTAERLADARLIRGKTPVDYAKILHALDQGWSPSRIRDKLGFSHDTTHKVAEAAAAAPTLAAVR